VSRRHASASEVRALQRSQALVTCPARRAARPPPRTPAQLAVRIKGLVHAGLERPLGVHVRGRALAQRQSGRLVGEQPALALLVKGDRRALTVQVALDGAEGQRLGFESAVFDGQAFIQDGLVQVFLVLGQLRLAGVSQ